MAFTDDQQESLDELRKFIDFVYGELKKVTNKSYSKKKKTIFLPMYVNACDLADSVHILLEKERVNSAQNLIRGLQETWINTRFIFINGSYLWADSYLHETELDMKKFVNGVRQVRATYPDVDTAKVRFDEKRLKQIEKRAQRSIEYMKKNYPTLPAIPNITISDISKNPYTLRDKTKVTDNILATRAKPKSLAYSDEYQYLMVYKYFSGGTHIGASYLATNLVKRDRTETTILKHGRPENIQLCAWSALAFLFDITNTFSKQFGGHPSLTSLKQYQATINRLKDKIPD